MAATKAARPASNSRSALAAFAVNNSLELFKPPETTRSHHPNAYKAAPKTLPSTKNKSPVRVFEERSVSLTQHLCHNIDEYSSAQAPAQKQIEQGISRRQPRRELTQSCLLIVSPTHCGCRVAAPKPNPLGRKRKGGTHPASLRRTNWRV